MNKINILIFTVVLALSTTELVSHDFTSAEELYLARFLVTRTQQVEQAQQSNNVAANPALTVLPGHVRTAPVTPRPATNLETGWFCDCP